jgi:hypothetical protein
MINGHGPNKRRQIVAELEGANECRHPSIQNYGKTYINFNCYEKLMYENQRRICVA